MQLRAVGQNIKKILPDSVEQNFRYIFDCLPEWGRFGFDLIKWKRFLAESENWSRSELLTYQKNMLEKLISFSVKNIPFYRDTLGPYHISLNIEDFNILTKENVKHDSLRLTPEKGRLGSYEIKRTSGSTGVPIKFLIPSELISKERAFWKRLYQWGGYKKRDKILTIRGIVKTRGQKRPFASRYIKYDNHLILSTAGLNQNNINYYIKRINEFKPQVISAFPSILFILCHHINRNGMKIHSPKFIHTSSETLYPEVRKLIQNSFESKVLNWYGLNERCVTAQECPEYQNMHINMEYGYLEVMKDNKIDTENTGKGYILGTGFDNFIMPLVRYNTKDVGSISDEFCPCGRESLLLKDLEGRIDDFIITSEERYIPPSFFGVLMKNFDKIGQFQVIQETDMKIHLYVTSENVLPVDYLQEIRANFKDNLDETIHIEQVQILNKTPQGKFRRVISKISTDKY